MVEYAENVFSQFIRRVPDERMHCNVFAKNEQPGRRCCAVPAELPLRSPPGSRRVNFMTKHQYVAYENIGIL